MFSTLSHVTSEIDRVVPAKIAAMLKLLLQEKHLYQSVVLDFEPDFQNLSGGLPSHEQSKAITYGLDQLSAVWRFLDPSSGSKSPLSGPGTSITRPILPPDAELFCSTCSQIEVFSCLSVHDLDSVFSRVTLSTSRPALQVFLFSYLCQSCKTFPEAFLVRREHNRLVLSGRAPIEHVDIPSAIPKHVRRFYSDAVTAHQSGQTLAGLLLLRTLVEQWCRLTSSHPSVQSVALIDEYLASLPEDFKIRFPSIRELYSDLSAAIHSAAGSSDFFDSVKDRIVAHFEARRLFTLSDGAV
jgi:hypothetical protein